MLDVLRAIGERAPVDADHPRLAVQHARQASPEPTADAGDDDGSVVFVRVEPPHQRNTLRRLASPRRSMSEIVWRTSHTFSATTVSSSSEPPLKRIGSPK